MSVRARALAVSVLLFASCAPSRPPAPAIRSQKARAVSRSFIEETFSRRKVAGLGFKAFNTGSIRTRGAAVSSLKSWSAKVRLDVPAFLIRHPVEGPVLFDLGLSPSAAATLNDGLLTTLAAKFESRPGEDLVSQLRAEGLAPAEVKWIVLSHLHQDHVVALDAYPNAGVIVSKKEWEGQKAQAARGRDPKVFDPAAWEGKLRLRLVDLDGEPPYGAFDHGLDLFSDGTIMLVGLPGHTEGSIGAWINLDAGPVLLAGDAAWVVDNYMDLALPHARGMADPAAYQHSLEMMRAMQEAMPRLVIFPGHDLTPRTLTQRDDLPLAVFKP